MIHHFLQAAMLKADALIRKHAVGAALELAADGDIRSICAMIVDASVTLHIHTDAQLSLARPGDKNAQIGCHQHVRVFAHRVVGFDRAAIEGHHERTARGVVDGSVLS
jgi:urease beta subunit